MRIDDTITIELLTLEDAYLTEVKEPLISMLRKYNWIVKRTGATIGVVVLRDSGLTAVCGGERDFPAMDEARRLVREFLAVDMRKGA